MPRVGRRRPGSMKIVHTKLAMKIRNEAPSRKALTEEKSFSVWRFAGVLEHPPGLAEEADEEQGEERQVEEDEHGPEVHLGPAACSSSSPVILGGQ